jgi:hypothetical protein
VKSNRFPAGWDEQSVRELSEHYEGQTDEEAAAEHEAALSGSTLMKVPVELVPVFRDLIARHRRKHGPRKSAQAS